MMLYLFIKNESGNVIRVGHDCDVPSQLVETLKGFSDAGYVLAEASEYDLQVINGAVRGAVNAVTDAPVNLPPDVPSTMPVTN